MSDDEIWRWIPGFEGRYKVSSFGRIMSLPNRRRKFAGLLKPRSNSKGYQHVDLCPGDGSSWTAPVHYLVLLAFVGLRPAKDWEARHLDGQKTNNRFDNLAWGTPEQNREDKARHGKTARGELVGRAKLREAQIRQIINLCKKGVPTADISRLYHVGFTTIVAIRSGQSWKHIARQSVAGKS